MTEGAAKGMARWRRRSPPKPSPIRAADLSRRGAAAHRGRAGRRNRICRAAGLVLVQSFLHLGRQDQEHVRRLRARGHSSSRARPVHRPVAGRRGPSGDVVLSRPDVSMGANSTAGINRTRGLNENLAREILELHTLGVRTGYTQDDVIGFANVLTGWTLRAAGRQSRARRRIHLQSALHEPGAQKVLGKPYDDETRGARTRRAARSRRAIRQPRRTWPPSWPAISLPTRRPLHWWSGWRRLSSIPAATEESPGRWSLRRSLERTAEPNSSARASGSSAWCARPD